MRPAAKTGQFRLALALLLALLAVSTAVVPGTAVGSSGDGASVSSAPSVHDDPNNWLRLSAVARHTLSTAPPDTSWAVYSQPFGECGPCGWSSLGAVTGVATVAATPTPRSSRAPPQEQE